MELNRCLLCLFAFSYINVICALINVELTVLQYDNPLGTSYIGNNTNGDRKCCDVGGGVSCTSGNDTCDVFFVFCIGQTSNDPNSPGCNGCSIDMSTSQNIYSIKAGQNGGLTRYGNLSQWTVNQTNVIVQVLDIDNISLGNNDSSIQPDTVDQFSQPLTFQPSPRYWNSTKHVIHLQQHVSLDIQLRVWCADGWVGDSCNISCNHDDYHTCAASNGILEPLLECSVTDVLVLQMLVPIKDVASPRDLGRQLVQFVANFVCPKSIANVSMEINGVRSSGPSQTDVLFYSKCNGETVSRLKFQETLYVLGAVHTRLPTPSDLFGVKIKSPVTKFIPSDSSKVRMLVQVRIIYYENMAARNNCNRGTKGAYCNPRLTVDFDKNVVASHINVRNADRFVDCNGALVDTDDKNTTQSANSTYLFSLIKYPSFIRIQVSDLLSSGTQLAAYGLPMNSTIVGTNFLDALPHVYSGTASNTKLSVEVLAWCSNCFYGDQCQTKTQNCDTARTVVPPDCQSTNDCIHGACLNHTCLCEDGWAGTKCNIDIDECGLGYCQNAQTCINTPGNYTCTCLTGSTGTNCDIDINECLSNPCHGGSFCLDTYGSYSCICSNGTISEQCFPDFCASSPCNNNGSCSNNMDGTFNCTCQSGWGGHLCDKNENECLNADVCHNGGTCHDTNGGYYCQCSQSYTGLHCESDVNECDDNVCLHGGTCVNTFGGFNCTCDSHWTGSTCAVDVNECQTELNSCVKGDCRNTNGSFYCVCYPGFKGVNCTEDLDECHLELKSPCFNNGTCLNTPGSFSCNCPQAWTGEHCNDDVDECDDQVLACHMNGNCTNTIGGYNCTCLTGWNGDTCDVDIDECLINNPCQNNGQCTNKQGGYTCSCPYNWTGYNCETDVDECLTTPCNFGGTCQNTPGSFTCVCPSAWTGPVCEVDVNECLSQQSPCTHNGQCVNSNGGFSCICPPQWTGSICQTDNDECSVYMPCMHSGQCVNTVGAYSCVCPTAWTGYNCTDNVDECSVYPGICGNHGICTDTEGDYTCTCTPGYMDKNCTTDINECQDSTSCKNHGICTNNVGSFTCSCPSSWTGQLCDLDIDECQSTGACSHHGNCVNEPGTFSCQCTKGWTGLNCSTDNNECGQNPCLRGNCTNTPGSYTCVCNAGWKGDNCDTNIDYCQGIDCSRHGTCQDIINDFHCKCDFGFSGNQCEIDLDECNPNPCLHNGVCSDHEGYYQCACPRGWNGTNCDLDVDECLTNPCLTTERCVNTQGAYDCKPVNFLQPTTTTTTLKPTTIKVTPGRTQSTQGTQPPELGNTDKQSSSVVPIAGGAAAGGILLIVVVIVIVIMRRKRNQMEEKKYSGEVEVREIEDMDGHVTVTFGNPTYNTLYTEQTSA